MAKPRGVRQTLLRSLPGKLLQLRCPYALRRPLDGFRNMRSASEGQELDYFNPLLPLDWKFYTTLFRPAHLKTETKI